MSDELQHQGRFLSFYKRNSWEFVRRVNAHAVVAIAAMTDDNEVVLIEQERKVLGSNGERVIEIPAGLVGDDQQDDDVLTAARRELIEECGYQTEELQLHSCGPSSAGLTDEMITLVIARKLRRVGDGGGVDGEDIITHLVPADKVLGWLGDRAASGMFIDPKVFAGLCLLGIAEKQSCV